MGAPTINLYRNKNSEGVLRAPFQRAKLLSAVFVLENFIFVCLCLCNRRYSKLNQGESFLFENKMIFAKNELVQKGDRMS